MESLSIASFSVFLEISRYILACLYMFSMHSNKEAEGFSASKVRRNLLLSVRARSPGLVVLPGRLSKAILDEISYCSSKKSRNRRRNNPVLRKARVELKPIR
jgi:hypothetical protein